MATAHETNTESARRRRHLLAYVGICLIGSIIAAVAVIVLWKPVSRQLLTRPMCADFTDSVGLYVGNQVALMGLSVGRVESIEPRDGGVRVRMAVERDLKLPVDVGAVVIDSSIVADRRVEFSAPYRSGPLFDGRQCIPVGRTKTPRGVSEGFAAADRLLTDVLGPDANLPSLGRTDDLAQVMKGVDRNFGGAENEVVRILQRMVAAQGDPQQADAQIRRLLENSETLMAEASSRWPDLARVIATIDDSGRALTGFSQEFAGALASAVRFVPVLGRNMARYGDRILSLLDLVTPWVRLLAPFATRLAQAVAQLPGLAAATDSLFDPVTGALRARWTPPVVSVPRHAAPGVCAVLGQSPDCASKAKAGEGLISMILAAS
ncbi:MCE family protein [Gordonia sp. PDNC005]|uniref:MlaD family protein n=1 Tax=unclassified Gordonia (in: high G+C Gram-positive bacteria) TaxID=2657482 RepID=UPI0019666275|nr:MlaD family protein [Gordonia sp. PDNC005]QRY63196.1 MCE family protein [Gordonia sp. PDNC005]